MHDVTISVPTHKPENFLLLALLAGFVRKHYNLVYGREYVAITANANFSSAKHADNGNKEETMSVILGYLSNEMETGGQTVTYERATKKSDKLRNSGKRKEWVVDRKALLFNGHKDHEALPYNHEKGNRYSFVFYVPKTHPAPGIPLCAPRYLLRQ